MRQSFADLNTKDTRELLQSWSVVRGACLTEHRFSLPWLDEGQVLQQPKNRWMLSKPQQFGDGACAIGTCHFCSHGDAR